MTYIPRHRKPEDENLDDQLTQLERKLDEILEELRKDREDWIFS